MKIQKRDLAMIGLGVCFLSAFTFLTYSIPFLLPSEDLDREVTERLELLGARSLETGDVPVAAMLIFGSNTIGEGFNTVSRDSNVSGHAEINALNDAVHSLGLVQFSLLNRDSLILISTFEPCMMCRGALLEHRIRNVLFLKPKPVFHVIKEDLRSVVFHWDKKMIDAEWLQDSLFSRHPSYLR